MKTLASLICLLALSGCATTHATWQEAFADYDENGCQASLWSNKQATQCLSYISATYCDQRFGLTQSWKDRSSRSQQWVACAQDRYDYLAAQHNAHKQRVGAAFTQSGQAMMNNSSPPATNSATTGSVGHLTGEAKSGMNKICYYNVVGSTHTLNVGAAELCPLTANF